MKTDDGTKMDALTRSPNVQIPWSFSSDGTRLAYSELDPRASGFDLWTVPVRLTSGKLTAGEPQVLVRTPYHETFPSFSPDGRWIAHAWGQYGIWEVYVRAYPPDGSTGIKVSRGGGRIARWLPGGQQLLYRTDDQRLMVVDYEVKNGTFVAGKPRLWTPVQLADTGVLSNFDVDSTGRVLGLLPAAKAGEQQTRNHVTVMLNFAGEVRRRLSSPEK